MFLPRTLLNVPGYAEPVEFGVLVHFAYAIDDCDEEVREDCCVDRAKHSPLLCSSVSQRHVLKRCSAIWRSL